MSRAVERRIKYIFLTLLSAVLLLTPGCHRIPLHDPEGGLYLYFNVDFTPKVDLAGDMDLEAHPELAAKSVGKIPEMFHVIFYDIESHEQVYEDYLPLAGGFVNIAPGFYDVIAYGMGTEVTRVSDDLRNRGLGRAYTPAKQPTMNSTKAGTTASYIEEPDQIYVGSVENMEVPVHNGATEIYRLHMDLSPLVESWTFIAYNITGLQYVKSLNVTMTAQAPDGYLWDRRHTVRPVNLEFPTLVNPQTFSVKTVFNTFGKLPEFTGNAVLQVEVGTDGGRYRWQYDVTDQFDNPDNTKHLIIVTERIDIPEPGHGNSEAFGPTVNPWQGEVIDLIVR